MTTQHIPMAREDRPQYFQDPAVDRLLQMFLEVAAELWAVKDWQATVATLLEQKGVISREDINNFQPNPADTARLAEQREQYVTRIIRHISGKAEPLTYD